MKLLNGIDVADRPIIGVDWSRERCDVYDPRTGNKIFKTLEQVAENYGGGFLVLEAPAESYELQRRAVVLESFKKNGIIAYVFPSQMTSKYRQFWELKKTDTTDAKVVYRIATETKLSLHRFKPLLESDGFEKNIRNLITEDRYKENGALSLSTSKKYLKSIEVPSEYHDFIFSTNKQYRKQVGRILMAAEAVRKAGHGYREFRRVLGNYANGYKQILRSEYYYWWLRCVCNARLKRDGIKRKKILIDRINPKTGMQIEIRQWTEEEKQMRLRVRHEGQKVAQYLWHLTKKEI